MDILSTWWRIMASWQNSQHAGQFRSNQVQARPNPSPFQYHEINNKISNNHHIKVDFWCGLYPSSFFNTEPWGFASMIFINILSFFNSRCTTTSWFIIIFISLWLMMFVSSWEFWPQSSFNLSHFFFLLTRTKRATRTIWPFTIALYFIIQCQSIGVDKYWSEARLTSKLPNSNFLLWNLTWQLHL